MSFCCGASMIGTKGTLQHYRTRIQNVPLLLCPVCHRIEVHFLVENEYEILAEYAQSDGVEEVNFKDYVTTDDSQLFENCINHENDDPLELVRNQIDNALDLLALAKQWKDTQWESQLKRRLALMSRRRAQLMKQ
ncbi:hypothetical protein WJ0W_003244 [Paenibacillus melissococcoides]|uniref:YgiT-type zinc finger domain-containing protein n=1 Tax=Paenibacillus melissococcoides TaxID=2912268 RepID=A0ABM9G4A4_9BACL|nr:MULTISPECIES: hypothetical protein [Paenibacillus]MEB9892757.1 hypothetical protein [Bacillus cereus]CAH8246009.1 hypothetical protein WJ0W_003244 [Paenibacillus melissococcoides]CAH8712704.1 hypothetical protein WDD9_003324 [Paenibacillus melissococcoides]CAH8713474.1 hypothetical protein HTL2_003627 [Paenibacillus melissococcoides]GIO81779.1 hypothetical protein J6TS7_53890 [Paenibacillus dendritiformis]